MPFYRYECSCCQTVFKVLQQNGEDITLRCPACGSEELERLMPRIGVVYKGSGYYTTDYAVKGRESGASTSAKAKG